MNVPYHVPLDIGNGARFTLGINVPGSAVLGIDTSINAGYNTSDATATADSILYPYTAYVANGKVVGTIIDGDNLGYGNGGISNLVGVGKADYEVI